MTRTLLLAWRYIAFHKAKTAILMVCLVATILFPLTAHLLVSYYGDRMTARARSTPLVVGAKGNRFDLTLVSLYFRPIALEPINLAEEEAVRDSGLGMPIPLHLMHTARGYPIVGTSLEYFGFRGLELKEGAWPAQLGQVVVGAEVARALGVKPGDAIFSDQQSLYDITKTYPLKMHITGVLAPTDTPDDMGVFADVKTTWIIDGIMHGHQDVTQVEDESLVLERSEENVVTNAAIVEYNEVTPNTIASFHLHASPQDLPLSAMIVLPSDRKSSTLLKARYKVARDARMVVPAEVVDELLALVVKVQRLFDANFALVLVSTLLFLVLVVLLSLRIRKPEREILSRIGCSRMTVFWMQAAELGMIVAASAVLAGALAVVAVLVAPGVLDLP